MTHFLWVEDFKASETNREENIVSSTVDLVFGSILDSQELWKELAEEDPNDAQEFLAEKGIFLKLSLLEALEFIHDPDELSKIDFVVLDVDMPLRRDGQNDKNNYLPDLIEQYGSEEALKKIAGYQIYTELVIELGFPKAHILFCSNHAEYFDELKNKFSSANIKLPLSSNPSKPFLEKNDKEDITQWLKNAHCDYFVLRRGIIEGCRFLKCLVEQDDTNIQFRDFIKIEDNQPTIEIPNSDIQNYLDTLSTFLVLKEPKKENTIIQYRLFLRTLVHEWEENIDPNAIKKGRRYKDENIYDIHTYAWLSKMARNWTSHANLLDPLNPQIIVFLFMVNMRAMFKLPKKVQPYEIILLSCTPKIPIDKKSLRTSIGLLEQNINEVLSGLKIPEFKMDEDEKAWDKHFGEKINDIYRQETGSPNAEEHKFKMFLLQYFWVNQKKHIDTLTSSSDDFLPLLARHIYKDSFLEV